MRVFSLIPVLAAIATAVAGGPLPRVDNCASNMGCAVVQSAVKRYVSDQRFSRTVYEVTNAELLRRELLPKNPIVQRGAFP
jgi:hypothetical protein